MTDLSGLKVFITGATSGIGEATARRFAGEGAHLVLAARRQEKLDALQAELTEAHGAKVTTLRLDVRDRVRLAELQEAQPEAFRDVDVLVNNAGLARGLDPVQEGEPDDWDEMIDTNVKGLLHVTRAILPDMVKRGKGHVINLGSTAGHWVYPGGAVYCATKHAVNALSQALRLDVHGSGVRVSSVDPGHVETSFSDVRFKGDTERAEKVYAGWEPLIAEDVAETILWVASRPARVNIQDIVLMSTQQSSARDIAKPGQ